MNSEWSGIVACKPLDQVMYSLKSRKFAKSDIRLDQSGVKLYDGKIKDVQRFRICEDLGREILICRVQME